MSELHGKFLRDLFSVGLSNGIVLIGSIIIGFVVPKVLGTTEYGYYKIFTLYLGYVSLLHLGFVDGILLEFGGREYRELDKRKFRLYTRFFITFQLMISIIIILLSAFILNGANRIVFILLGVDTVAVNLTTYFQYISQSTMRFKELSTRKILLAVSKIILIALLIVLNECGVLSEVKGWMYVFGLVAIDIILTSWYIFTYKDITFGKREYMANEKANIIRFFKIGFVLTLSFQVSHLIFNLDRQFVSVLYSTETYGIYAFSYNLISMVTTVISAVSLVLFPHLKKKNADEIVHTFSDSLSCITIVSVSAMIGYYPLCVIIRWILPEYIVSLEYLKIIFPGLVITCCINIIIFTYYKALNEHLKFFKISCLVLILSSVLNYIAYLVFDSPSAISIASIITLFVWYITSERFFILHYHVKWGKNLAYLLIMSLCFYCTTF